MKKFYQRTNKPSFNCDVLIIGSGPGGSGAAYGSASNGVDAVFIDKKRKIGSPVECGEVMDPSLLHKFNVDIDPSLIEAEQDGTIFWINEQIKAENRSPLWKSITVDRSRLDKYFAWKATNVDANILVDAELCDVKFDNGKAILATIKTAGRKIKIKPKIIIAADGTNSKVAEIQGIQRPGKNEIGVTASFEMTNLNLIDPKKVQMFFDKFTFGGYGYIIPKSEHSANVGLGKLGISKHPWKALKTFINKNEIVRKQVEDAGILEIKMGYTPITGPTLPLRKGNVLYVGDAAGQNLSHVGEGTFPSYVCGRIAGETAAAAIKKETIDDLDEYKNKIDRTIGPMFEECATIRDNVFAIYESDLNKYDKLFLIGLMIGEIIPPKYYKDLKNWCNLPVQERIKKVESLIKKEGGGNYLDISLQKE